MDVIIIIIILFVFLNWICYKIQKRVGEEQARDWKDFVAANPHLFRKRSVSALGHTDDTQKKYIEEMWERWRNQLHINESSSDIRKERKG